MHLDHAQLQQMEQRYRATFINSLAGYRQAVLIGTSSAEGQENLAIFNSLMHIGANPPLWAFICRPDTVQRDTLRNILETNVYTFNYVRGDDHAKAHQTAAKYPTGRSEFDAVAFTPEYKAGWPAPFVAGAVVQVGMRFEERIDITRNGTIMIIGSIQHIHISDTLVGSDGFVHLHEADVLACSGLDAYYQPQFIDRLSYAKPDKAPTSLR